MRTIKASEFKAKCLKLLDEVAESGEAIVVTKNGKPVARLEPAIAKPTAYFGRGAGEVRIVNPDDDLVDTLRPEDIEDWYPPEASTTRSTRKRPA